MMRVILVKTPRGGFERVANQGSQWTCWDLNPGPPPCKGGDLPADLQAPLEATGVVRLFRFRSVGRLSSFPGPCYPRG